MNIFYKNTQIPFLIFLLAFAVGCGNLEQEVEIELPQYEPRLVVECYLEPGNNFQLLVKIVLKV